jgi:hypothetical protein
LFFALGYIDLINQPASKSGHEIKHIYSTSSEISIAKPPTLCSKLALLSASIPVADRVPKGLKTYATSTHGKFQSLYGAERIAFYIFRIHQLSPDPGNARILFSRLLRLYIPCVCVVSTLLTGSTLRMSSCVCRFAALRGRLFRHPVITRPSRLLTTTSRPHLISPVLQHTQCPQTPHKPSQPSRTLQTSTPTSRQPTSPPCVPTVNP